MLKRFLCLLLCVLICVPAFAEDSFTPLKKGDSGDAVYAMKQRLYELEYYSTTKLSNNFNKDTVETLRVFQKTNHLEETGVLDEKTYEVLFSDTAISRYEAMKTRVEFETIDWPERDEDGYLKDTDGEFIYENPDGGYWAYLSNTLKILIIKRADSDIPLEWFETEIWMRGDEQLFTVETNPARPGTRFSYPYDIAKDNNLVLGFSDDFYGHRFSRNEKTGVVIRNGLVYGKDTYSGKRLHNLPNLDVMAQFPDGSLKTYASCEITAQELINLGAVNAYCFGPILVRNGEIDELVAEGFYETKSPRQSLGMIEPGHYMLISVQGRMKSSDGCGLQMLARLMKYRSAVEALNLDGGQTMALVFNGTMINKLGTYDSRTFVRTVTSLICAGTLKNNSVSEDK